MSLKRYAAKRDQSEKAILQALKQVGADYLLLDKFDALVFYKGQLTMLEVKTGKGRITKSQQELADRGWPVQFVRDVDSALKAIGAMK